MKNSNHNWLDHPIRSSKIRSSNVPSLLSRKDTTRNNIHLRNMIFCIGIVKFFSFSPTPCGMWDLSFLTRSGTYTPSIGRLSLNHLTPEKVPIVIF